MTKKNIPFSPPDITDKEIESVVEVLKSGWITTGPKTKEFERRIAEYCHTEKAVALNSATACMEMTLRVLGIGPGDEVITSAYTYTASASIIHHVGAKIVLVDTQKDSYEMDYEQLESKITEKTKAIIPVDIAGIMCDYDKLFEIVERNREKFVPNNNIQKSFNRIVVVADAAHSFGATYKEKVSGEVADFTSFSFHAVKNLTTGEGGAVTWKNILGIDNEAIYKEYMLLSLHGQSKDALAKTHIGSWEYDIVAPNYKCNMTDIMAAIGLIQLDRYEEILDYRKQLVETYEQELKDVKSLKVLQHINDDKQSSCHLLITNVEGFDLSERNNLIISLAEQEISTNVHYKPLPLLSAYKNLGFKIEDYPNAYGMYKNEITLPLNSLMTIEDVKYIAEKISEEMC
ncbi:DegT/DnrJ/EryC1/StrS family aminotransferase [Vagococcus fluvialis]|uniref:DegT/DnrJ/EryC1/StrS family aminotransferase n=1 Tax=Vagococcus fluvialis TaxID=2738 RepID=UPI001A8D255C|nr:DegT/DnrJ/EryC1/StrS family aminotransferase [Vagococcus fluvialis]MBO0479506.1 DegT/DnrJ/EryC1/StrS family aminotransferase [Vagococcus fluvialis]MBO0484856.1 DegT/DnrJ/EryC1/StrS family aminotransferase [Vagococcus fluvialis]